MPLRNVENAIYNDVVDAWMIPLETPQTPVTRGGVSASASSPEPTHYALKIYPKTEDEQWQIEMMEDVRVSYIPFGYSQLTSREVESLPQSKTRSAVENTFAEKSPYTVTYDYFDASDGGPTGPRSFQLPILYVEWPIARPLPDDMEYAIDHEVFRPLPSPATRATTRAAAPYMVVITFYDEVTGTYIPLTNMDVHVRTNEYFYDPWNDRDRPGYWTLDILEGVTDDRGAIDIGPLVAIYPSLFPNDPYCLLNFDINYRDPDGKWKVTAPNSTVVAQYNDFGLFYFDWSPRDGDFILREPDERQLIPIGQALKYFFDEQTDIPNEPSNTLKIIANNYESISSNGSFSAANCTINIYNNGNPRYSVVGTTLHELGHFTHCYQTQSIFNNSNSFLKESFASYVGWYLGREYYKSLGWTPPNDNSSIISHNAQQGWTKTTSVSDGIHYEWYSPLFVDLTDNYNQKTSSTPFCPNDNITGVPASAVWNIISTISTYSQVRSKIVNLAGSSSGFNDWIRNFDESPANN